MRRNRDASRDKAEAKASRPLVRVTGGPEGRRERSGRARIATGRSEMNRQPLDSPLMRRVAAGGSKNRQHQGSERGTEAQVSALPLSALLGMKPLKEVRKLELRKDYFKEIQEAVRASQDAFLAGDANKAAEKALRARKYLNSLIRALCGSVVGRLPGTRKTNGWVE